MATMSSSWCDLQMDYGLMGQKEEKTWYALPKWLSFSAEW
jgi:hypothetical protein